MVLGMGRLSRPKKRDPVSRRRKLLEILKRARERMFRRKKKEEKERMERVRRASGGAFRPEKEKT